MSPATNESCNLNIAELMLTEELKKLNNNNCKSNNDVMMGKNKVDLNEFELEEERLNFESWQYFEELTSVVSKIEKLSEIFDEIQALLHSVTVTKG